MLIHLHSPATPPPKVRAVIQASAEPASSLAERFGTTALPVCKGKHRASVHGRSHMPHRLQTTLTPAQEAVAVMLRKTPPASISPGPLKRRRSILPPPLLFGPPRPVASQVSFPASSAT